jgi:hypothetical protein
MNEAIGVCGDCVNLIYYPNEIPAKQRYCFFGYNRDIIERDGTCPSYMHINTARKITENNREHLNNMKFQKEN